MDTANSRIADLRSLPSVFKTSHHGRDATCETTPRNIWASAVYEISGVTHVEGKKYAGARISRAYANGEPAYIAANMVRELVREGLIADRADGEVAAMRRVISGAHR